MVNLVNKSTAVMAVVISTSYTGTETTGCPEGADIWYPTYGSHLDSVNVQWFPATGRQRGHVASRGCQLLSATLLDYSCHHETRHDFVQSPRGFQLANSSSLNNGRTQCGEEMMMTSTAGGAQHKKVQLTVDWASVEVQQRGSPGEMVPADEIFVAASNSQLPAF